MNNTDNQAIENEIPEELISDSNSDTDIVTEDQPETSATDVPDWQDKYIRLSAEFDNYRKRTLKEKMELVQSGGADFIKAILPTADDFDRALNAMQEGPDKEGMTLIYKNFLDALKSKGVTEIEATGKDFDVDFHEAIARVPATESNAKGTIIDVIQKGYMLRDKVLRFAKVVVAE